jgi:hypothetical protein
MWRGSWRASSGGPWRGGARVPWATRGRLEVEAPAELGEAASWTLRLILPEGEAGVSARLVSWELCGSDEALKAGLDRLDGGERGPMERLAADCPPARRPGPSGNPAGGGGQDRLGHLDPAFRDGLVRAGDEGAAGGGGAGTGADRTLPGDGLLRRARLFFAYEPR